jgi:hypothetical protein
MNFTILLALALGALTGIEMPVDRVRAGVVVADGAGHASEKRVRAARLTTFRRRARSVVARLVTCPAVSLQSSPLAGASTPRAPAIAG